MMVERSAERDKLCTRIDETLFFPFPVSQGDKNDGVAVKRSRLRVLYIHITMIQAARLDFHFWGNLIAAMVFS